MFYALVSGALVSDALVSDALVSDDLVSYAQVLTLSRLSAQQSLRPNVSNSSDSTLKCLRSNVYTQYSQRSTNNALKCHARITTSKKASLSLIATVPFS